MTWFSAARKAPPLGMKRGDGTRTWGKGGSKEQIMGIPTEGDQKTLRLVG